MQQMRDNHRNSGKMNVGKIKKITIGVAAGIFAGITVSQSMYSLQEDEYAVVQTFGYAQVVETPGIKFKIPYIQNVYKVSKASKQFAVGYNLETDESIDKESFMITSDYNFVNVDFYFEYQITDPIKYFYASEEPEVIVKNLAQSYIRDTVGSHGVDEVLTTGKYAIQSEIKTKLQERMELEDIGIQITNAVIQDAEVPTAEVAQAFKNVEDAKQGMETAINNANADANTRIPAANAQADKIIKDAQAQKEALIAEAEGQGLPAGVRSGPNHHSDIYGGHKGGVLDMKVKVYRSLDCPSSLFGMKGAYLLLFVAALALAMMLAFVVGALTSSILGTMLFLVLALAAYFSVLYVQSLYSVKDLWRLFSSLNLHRWIMTLPVNFSDIWNSP